METITAQELRIGGASLIKEILTDLPEVVISVRGRNRYVVIDIERFHYLLECQLEAALLEARDDQAARQFAVERVEEHMRRR